jgi:hypothetical protein
VYIELPSRVPPYSAARLQGRTGLIDRSQIPPWTYTLVHQWIRVNPLFTRNYFVVLCRIAINFNQLEAIQFKHFIDHVAPEATIVEGIFGLSPEQGDTSMYDLLSPYRSRHAAAANEAIPQEIPYLRIDSYLAASLLQKAIRRSETLWALKAGLRLFDIAPSNFWRRLVVTLFEDVGLDDLDLAALVVSSAPERGLAPLKWPQIVPIIVRLSNAPKSQAANHILHLGIHDLEEAGPLEDMVEYTFDRIVRELHHDDRTAVQKAKLAWQLSGVGVGRGMSPQRHPDADRERTLSALGDLWPSALFEAVVRTGLRLTGLPLPLAASFAFGERDRQVDINIWTADKSPQETLMGGLPSWVYDQYTRAGKRALGRSATECAHIAGALSGCSSSDEAKTALACAHFEFESGVLAKRIVHRADLKLHLRVREMGSFRGPVLSEQIYGALQMDWAEVLQMRREEIGNCN